MRRRSFFTEVLSRRQGKGKGSGLGKGLGKGLSMSRGAMVAFEAAAGVAGWKVGRLAGGADRSRGWARGAGRVPGRTVICLS